MAFSETKNYDKPCPDPMKIKPIPERMNTHLLSPIPVAKVSQIARNGVPDQSEPLSQIVRNGVPDQSEPLSQIVRNTQ